MANIYLGMWCFACALLLCIPWLPQTAAANDPCKEIRNDTRLMMNILKNVSDNTQANYKTQMGVEKRHFKTLTNMLLNLVTSNNNTKPLLDVVPELHQQIANVTAILLRNEELTKKQNTNEVLENIMKSIQALTLTVESLKKDSDKNSKTTTEVLEKRLNMANSKIDDVKNEIKNLTNFDEEKLRSICVKVIDMSPFEKHIASAEELLKKYSSKLDEYDAQANRSSEAELANQARLNDTLGEMKRQSEEITRVQKLLVAAEGVWKDLPRLSHLDTFQAGTNLSLEAIKKALVDLNSNSDISFGNVTSEIRGLSGQLTATNASLQQSVGKGNLLVDFVTGDLSRGMDTLRNQMLALAKNEKLIFQISETINASKKTIDFFVNSAMIRQVGDLLSQQSRNIKADMKGRLREVESSIMARQAALNSQVKANVTEEMETFWRQLAVLQKQLGANKAAILDLANYTDKYASRSSNSLMELNDHISKTVQPISIQLKWDHTGSITFRIKKESKSVHPVESNEMEKMARSTKDLSGALNPGIVQLLGSKIEIDRMMNDLGRMMVDLRKDVKGMLEKLDAVAKLDKTPVL